MNFDIEDSYLGKIVAGVDEAGRGPLAGPLFAAAVIVDRKFVIDGINDSKKLSQKKREYLYDVITEKYVHGLGIATVQEIKDLNIHVATKLACLRAVSALGIIPEVVIVDGNMRFTDMESAQHFRELAGCALQSTRDSEYVSIVRGDQISVSIAAASIIAKVSRDKVMFELNEEYPCYGWAQNKGYPTKSHIDAIMNNGQTIHHRNFVVKSLLARGG